jgi:hypothetical protein
MLDVIENVENISAMLCRAYIHSHHAQCNPLLYQIYIHTSSIPFTNGLLPHHCICTQQERISPCLRPPSPPYISLCRQRRPRQCIFHLRCDGNRITSWQAFALPYVFKKLLHSCARSHRNRFEISRPTVQQPLGLLQLEEEQNKVSALPPRCQHLARLVTTPHPVMT